MKSAYQKLHDLAFALWDVEAVLTSASDHPLVIERDGPDGKTERGFLLKLHEEHPEASLSPLYLNFRMPDNSRPGPLTQEIVTFAASCMHGAQATEGSRFDAVVGVPRAGDPFAKAFAQLVGALPLSMEKDGRHVTRLRSSVLLTAKTLVVDDVITDAGSKLEAIDILRNEGTVVTDVVVLVDREQGGREKLAEQECRLHSVFTITDLLDIYVNSGRMTPQLRAEIQTYPTSQWV